VTLKSLRFIVNPKAGTAHKSSLPLRLLEGLDQKVFQADYTLTEYAGHARQLTYDSLYNGVDVVVAVGGDGTVNECASALQGSNTALGIIPMGSGNGLARDLGIPMDVKKALQVLNQPTTTRIDCGWANGNLFFCTCGVGFDAYISHKFVDVPYRGLIGYLRKVVEEFIHYQSQHYEVDHRKTVTPYHAFSMTFANAAQFGNNAYISPQADIQDGALDLSIVKDYPKHLGLAMGLRLFNKSMHKSKYVEIIKLTEARIKLPPRSYFHLDGEPKIIEGDTLHVKVLPSKLKVVVPSKRTNS
jgi:YegS/Rv2252/BmrU family lipid kinase